LLGLLGVVMLYFAAQSGELAPTEDQGVIFAQAQLPAAATVDQLEPDAAAVNQIFFKSPETEFSFQITNPNMMIAGLVTKPWGDRQRSIYRIMPEVLGRLATVPGVQINGGLPSALPGGDFFPVEFVISSTADYDQLLPLAQTIALDAAKSGLFFFPPIVDIKLDQPQSEVDIDRDKVASFGLNLQDIGTDLSAGIGGNYINFFDISGRSYKVISQVKRVDRLNPRQLENIYVHGPGGQLVPLSTVATIHNSTVARSLNRFQQLNAVTLTGMPAQGLEASLKFLENDATRVLPKGYHVDYMGESRQLRKEGGAERFWNMMGLAVILIFLVLAAQFNSFRDPFIIIAGSFPLALFGAAIFMFLRMPNPNVPYWTNAFTTTFNIYSQVGLVTLAGLIAKNGILIVEFANKLQLAGKSKFEAVHEASLTRLRPVLMTSVATIAGHLPLTWVTGPGAAARNAIGRVLVGGMTIGTVFTLFVVPCVYLLIAKDHAQDRIREAEIDALEGRNLEKSHA
jgi:multidrug efflux pump